MTALNGDAIASARERIATAAADLADKALEATDVAVLSERAAAIKTVAEAVCNVAFGPQGGDYDRRDDGKASMDYRYSADYHHTQHPGEQRKPPAGFAVDAGPGKAVSW